MKPKRGEWVLSTRWVGGHKVRRIHRYGMSEPVPVDTRTQIKEATGQDWIWELGVLADYQRMPLKSLIMRD